jgi:hypothetical protein
MGLVGRQITRPPRFVGIGLPTVKLAEITRHHATTHRVATRGNVNVLTQWMTMTGPTATVLAKNQEG